MANSLVYSQMYQNFEVQTPKHALIPFDTKVYFGIRNSAASLCQVALKYRPYTNLYVLLCMCKE